MDTSKRATLCISIDLELAWGMSGFMTPEYLRHCLESERAIVARLLEIFDEHDIPATWAIVGHLLAPPDATVPPHERAAWYAPDVIEKIQSARAEHEIGTHTFRHVYFTEESEDALRRDLDQARVIHEQHGLPFTSLVFPSNMVGHTEVLRDAGINIYRGRHRGWKTRADERSVKKRLESLADQLAPTTPPAVAPVVDPAGVVELPASMLLPSRNGPRKWVPPSVTIAKASRAMESAVRAGSMFHLWFHPSNFHYDAETQYRVLESILREAVRHRHEGDLEAATMAEVYTAMKDSSLGAA